MSRLSLKAIQRQVNPTGRVISLTASLTLSHDVHAGPILLMDAAGATLTFTLPEAAATGNTFRFRVGTVNTSNYIIASAGSDLMDGSLALIVDTDTSDNMEGFQAANAVTITLNGDAQGGFRIGDWVELTDILINQWTVRGQTTTNSASGTTPFAT